MKSLSAIFFRIVLVLSLRNALLIIDRFSLKTAMGRNYFKTRFFPSPLPPPPIHGRWHFYVAGSALTGLGSAPTVCLLHVIPNYNRSAGRTSRNGVPSFVYSISDLSRVAVMGLLSVSFHLMWDPLSGGQRTGPRVSAWHIYRCWSSSQKNYKK